MPKGPVSTPFDDYVADAIPSAGKNANGANYDEYSGITAGDSDTGGFLGTILTSYDIPGGTGETPEAGDMPTTYEGK